MIPCSWTPYKALPSSLKLRNYHCVPVLAVITVALSAQVLPAGSDLPSNQQVIAFVTESIDWYRHCAIERQIATEPSDLLFLQDNRPRAAQILQLSFDFARAEAAATAQAGSPKAATAIATGSPDLAQFVQLENKTEAQRRQASDEIDAIKKELQKAHGADQSKLQAALDAAQSRLDVLQAGLSTLGQVVDFLQAFEGGKAEDLASSVEDLTRTVPEITDPAAVVSSSSTASLIPKPRDSGLLSLSSDVSALERKLSILDDEVRRTQELRQSSDPLRDPLLAAINKRLPAIAENALPASDLAELQQQKAKLDELAGIVKTLSPAIVALDKQRVLLAAYSARLTTWRAAVVAQDKRVWTSLISRLLGTLLTVGALVIIGAVARKVTRRHMRDTDRRHFILVIQRIVLWVAIVAVVAFAFASDFASLATFLGLLAAGVAVALHSLIVAALGYFVLVGRRGIRIGDRVEISGVIGDVIDIGWLQFQLREIDRGTRQPTGGTVTFSNSFVFLSPATGLSRLNRHFLKSAQLEVAAKAPES